MSEPAKFSVRIPSEIMELPFMNNVPQIKIRCEYNCECFNWYKPNDIFFYNPSGTVTRKDLYNCLVQNGYSTCCNHSFLEDFFTVSDTIVIPIFSK
jgi:hypothetical protein